MATWTIGARRIGLSTDLGFIETDLCGRTLTSYIGQPGVHNLVVIARCRQRDPPIIVSILIDREAVTASAVIGNLIRGIGRGCVVAWHKSVPVTPLGNVTHIPSRIITQRTTRVCLPHTIRGTVVRRLV